MSRFDRSVADGVVHLIHQEDASQALDRDPGAARGKGKYEAAGGPALIELAGLLDRFAAHPLAELRRLVAAATFTVRIGYADAHRKNLSLLHEPPGVVRLAPLYDTVPTALSPNLPRRAAMTINNRGYLADVTIADIAAEATR